MSVIYVGFDTVALDEETASVIKALAQAHAKALSKYYTQSELVIHAHVREPTRYRLQPLYAVHARHIGDGTVKASETIEDYDIVRALTLALDSLHVKIHSPYVDDLRTPLDVA